MYSILCSVYYNTIIISYRRIDIVIIVSYVIGLFSSMQLLISTQFVRYKVYIFFMRSPLSRIMRYLKAVRRVAWKVFGKRIWRTLKEKQN